MREKFLHTICCSSCGKVLSKSFQGTQTYINCPRCGAELYYEVGENGPTIKMLKEPKNPPVIPQVPA